MRRSKWLLPLFLLLSIAATTTTLAAERPGRRFALVIGINDYDLLGKLESCRADAEAIARVLVDRAGFEPGRLCLLADGERPRQFQPTYANMRRRIEQFTSLPRKDDTLLVFFAGHGLTIGGEAYLMPVDGSDEHTGISMSWLRERMNASKASRKILILDACHSGTATRGVSGIAPDLAAGVATLVMTSCDADQISYPEDGHGVFTAGLLAGLSGLADRDGDGLITGAELFSTVRDHVEKWSLRTGKTQTPRMTPAEAADLVIARVPDEVRLAAQREQRFKEALSEGERLLRARLWQQAEGAFRRALAVEGYAADAEALEGLRTALGGAEAYRKRTAYESALALAQAAYARAVGTEREDLWEQVKSHAERAIASGHSDLSAAKKLLEEARRHLGPFVYTGWPFDAQEAARRRQETAHALGCRPELTLDLGGGVSMELVLIPAGEFMMGSGLSPQEVASRYGGDAYYYDEEHPQHRVRITRSFYMGKYEVTQEQYEALMGTNPADFKGAKNPVEQVSWNDAVEFCRRLSARTGVEVRLPTEAEWEYACRAGSSAAHHFGDSVSRLGDYAWYYGNSGHKTHPVGGKRPNGWGLYDMHGNVEEWCTDWYGKDYYAQSPTLDPKGPSSGTSRVCRGGCWDFDPTSCRSAHRNRNRPTYAHADIGFRVAVTPVIPFTLFGGAGGGAPARDRIEK